MKDTRLGRFFDLKSAILGALLLGLIVGAINSGHGTEAVITAGLKQAGYTFFVAGFIMQFCRWLALREQAPKLAIATATLVPTVVTVVMVYGLHSFKGTAEPEWSTLPVVILSLVSFFLVSRSEVMESQASV